MKRPRIGSKSDPNVGKARNRREERSLLIDPVKLVALKWAYGKGEVVDGDDESVVEGRAKSSMEATDRAITVTL